MKLEKYKERNKKKIGIILFTITCIMLITGVILYRTFAIFETNDNLDMIKGSVQNTGDIEFAFYINGDLSKTAPEKGTGYSLDTSSSYCKDVLNGNKVSNVNWNDESWSIEIKNVSTTKTKCYLYFKEIYKEKILNGAVPDLGNGRLIPVTISNSELPSDVTAYTNADSKYGGKVYKADITNQETPWYSYEQKRWANAIILKDGVGDNYQPGDEIKEKDIESYFVWIPRYSYVLQDSEETFDSYSSATNLGTQPDVKSVYDAMQEKNGVGNKGASNAFEIEFGSKDKGVSATLLSKGASIIHPAFETFNSNGFWIGKFETGYNQNSDGSVMPISAESWSKAGAEVNEEKSTKVIIKPNVYSWRNINVSNAFYTSYNYQRELESHMIKNMEWGAVAYLTQSKYGRCTEIEGKMTCEKVRINNVGSHVTGFSAKEEPTCGYTGMNESCNSYEDISKLGTDGQVSYNYYNSDSAVASTTGNYSGVYDMAGGATEYVMGVMQTSQNDATPASGRRQSDNSGFNGLCLADNYKKEDGKPWPSSKYYDLYDYAQTNQNYNQGKLGDGTKEFGPFYSVVYQSNVGIGPTRFVGSYNANTALFVDFEHPWLVRGGDYLPGTDAGLALFSNSGGDASKDQSFRIVLMP